jgi:hypothetical protein
MGNEGVASSRGYLRLLFEPREGHGRQNRFPRVGSFAISLELSFLIGKFSRQNFVRKSLLFLLVGSTSEGMSNGGVADISDVFSNREKYADAKIGFRGWAPPPSVWN